MKSESQGVQPNSVSSLSDCNRGETESAVTLSERSSAKRKNERDKDFNNDSSSQSSEEAPGGEHKRLRLETPKYTDEERERVLEILEREFNKELQSREEEAMLIEERIQRAQRTLQYLCYAVVSDFYSRDKTIAQQVTSTRQRRIHPAVKKLLAGKHPKDSTQESSCSTESSNQDPTLCNNSPCQGKAAQTPPNKEENSTLIPESSSSSTVTKVPRYIPPKPKDSPGKSGGSSRGVHNKVKQRMVIGNVSKWLPAESGHDSATHKWMVYVRGPKDAPDISGFVDKVRFFLHPSYRPNDVVEVVQAPFHLSRRGWGEFPVRVQIHFQDPLNKPVDVIHNLKLDRTCTGLQTLGAETVFDVWINKNNNIRPIEEPDDIQVMSPLGQELEGITIVDEDDEDDFGLRAPSPTTNTPLSSVGNIKAEPMSPPSAPVEEDISSVVMSFLQKPNVSESSNTPKDSVFTSGKTDCSVNQLASVSSSGIEVSSPAKGLKSTTPSNVLVSSPSKVLLKQATPVISSVMASSPSKVLIRPTTPVVSSGTVASSSSPVQLKPATSAVSSEVIRQSVAQLNQIPGTVISGKTEAQLRPTTPVTSPGRLVSSSSKVLVKPSIPGVVVSNPVSTVQVKQTVDGPGSLAPNPSKVLILNRPPLVSKPASTSTVKSDIVLSPSPSNAIPADATKLVPLQTNKASGVAGRTIKIVQSTDSSAKILLPGGSNQILTASGQVVKVVSPGKIVQNSHMPVSGAIKTTLSNSVTNVLTTAVTTTNTVSTVTALQVPVAPKTGVPQNQNVLGVPISKTPGNTGKPISLVKYKAPDGSIRFLQVSQINAARPAAPASQPQTPTPLEQTAVVRPKQVLVRPTNPGVTPVPRNQPPLIRLPTPSNVTPTQAPGNVLMFRNGKIYLVRPSPTVTTTTSTNQSSTPRQTAPQTLTPQIPQTLVNQPALQTVQPVPVVTATQPTVTDTVCSLAVQKPSNIKVQQSETSPLFVPPSTVVTSVPSLVNTVRAVPTMKLMLEKQASLAKPRGPIAPRQGVSLLKSSVLQQSPASSPSVSPVNSPCSSPMPSPSSKIISHRVILPKPTLSPVSTSTYRSKMYKQMLSTAVRSCPTKTCPGGVGRAIRWMVRNLPLISAEARHPEYQVLHPYCAPDMNTFLNWNLGKQRACELLRAQTVWKLLQDVGWDESELWTVREILVWARFHGYTPGLPLTDSGSGIESSVLDQVCNYKPIDEEVAEWLNNQENSNLTGAVDVESSDEELDVVNVNLSPSKACIKQEPLERTSSLQPDPVEDMSLEEPHLGTGAFVNDVLNNIGIQLEPEQLMTGVRYPAAQRVLVQAVQSLVDDIVRRSLAKAWGPNIARSPRSIELPHVCSAILSRPEFDFMTCAGLGLSSLPPTTTDGPSTSKMNSFNPS